MAADLTTSAPPEPKRLSVRLDRGLDRLRLVSAKRQWAAAAFLILWLTLWTFGCIMLLGLVIAQFSFFTLLFAVPFWAAELFVFSLVGSMIASREEVVLDADGLAYRWTIWRLPVKRRRVPLSEIVRIDDTFVPAGEDNNIKHQFAMSGHRLTVETIGQPLQLPGGSSEQEQAWLAHVFAETLAALKRFHGPIERVDGNQPVTLPSPDELPAVLELRPPAGAAVPRPSDTSWQYAYDFDAISFRERGRLNLGGAGLLLFINAFWNGITGVFVAGLWGFAPPGQKAPNPPDGWSWWGMFLFLLPFEIVGLVVFTLLVGVLSEPFRRSRWTLARNAAWYRLSYLGIGRTWRYEIRELDHLELRKRWATTLNDSSDEDDEQDDEEEDDEEADEPETAAKQDRVSGADLRFHLALVDRGGKDVCLIEHLTLGEACWMADVILRERAAWFK
jgi:hypothetical protein